MASGATAPASSSPATAKVKMRVLSNERTFTRFAHPWQSAIVRAQPTSRSRRVGRLHLQTEDGFAETYLLLRSAKAHDGTVWIDLRLPQRPNGRTGWVPRDALGPIQLTRIALIVHERTRRVVFTVRGRARWSARIGIGKRTTPTPRGHFWVREKFPGDGKVFGAYAFGTSAYSRQTDWPGGGVVGIHGTNQPQLIPGRPSHGCIRLRNRDIRWLARHLPVGAPVWVTR